MRGLSLAGAHLLLRNPTLRSRLFATASALQDHLQPYAPHLRDLGVDLEVRDAGPGKGRGLFATKHIAEGQILFGERPLISLEGARPGGDARAERFPTMAAQFAVSAIMHDARQRMQNTVKKETNEGVPRPATPWAILELCHVEMPAETINHLREPHQKALAMVSEELKLSSAEQAEMLVPLALFARIMAVLHMNVMSVFSEPLSSPTAIPRASILPFLGSFFNHDCEPNASLKHPLDEDGNVWFIAERAISAGEEICITYVDPAPPQEERQRHLEWAYGFRCTCNACRAAEQK